MSPAKVRGGWRGGGGGMCMFKSIRELGNVLAFASDGVRYLL